MPIIREIHEQYLREAELLFESWDLALDSPAFTLDELLEGPERRVVAQIEALAVGGAAVVDELLLPILEEADDDEHRTRAACLTIMVSASIAACEAVVAALEQVGPVGWAAIVRALELAPRDGLGPWLARELPRCEGAALAGRLRALVGRKVDLGPALRSWLASSDPRVSEAAARLARDSHDPELVRELVVLLRSGDAPTRRAALHASLVRELAGAWALVHEWARASEDPLQLDARRWLAMVGDASAHAWLIEQARAQPSPSALVIAGLTGRVASVELALELLDDEAHARVAGEVLGVIAGAPREDEQLWLDGGGAAHFGADEREALPDLDDDDLDADLVPTPELLLPLPNPPALRAWWSDRRSHFVPGLRYRDGVVLEARHVSRLLLELPMRRRHALAEELALRSRGRIELDTCTWARAQRARIHATAFEGLDLQGAPWR